MLVSFFLFDEKGIEKGRANTVYERRLVKCCEQDVCACSLIFLDNQFGAPAYVERVGTYEPND
mgnify:FL=1